LSSLGCCGLIAGGGEDVALTAGAVVDVRYAWLHEGLLHVWILCSLGFGFSLVSVWLDGMVLSGRDVEAVASLGLVCDGSLT
jgi:hypothetical protein